MFRIFNVKQNKWLASYYVDDYKKIHHSLTADIRLSMGFSGKADALKLADKLGDCCIAYGEDETIIRVDDLDHNGTFQIEYDKYVSVKREIATDESAVLEIMQDHFTVDYNDWVEVKLTDIDYEVLL